LDAQLPDIPPAPALPHASDYLAARRFNDRSRTDRSWQTTRGGLSALMLNRCRLGLPPDVAAAEAATEAGPDLDDRLLDWLWGLLTHPTWAVAAHLPGHELPSLSAPLTDLAACEMALAMAEARETLLPWISHVSDTLAESMVTEIDRRVLRPFIQEAGQRSWNNPEQVHNNWTGVCVGSILAAVCSLEAQGHPRPEAKARAVDLLNVFLEKAFTPGGECDEGLAYWAYGISWACRGWMRLDAETFEARVNLPRLKQVADYPRRSHLFGETFYAANDASPSLGGDLNYLWWLAEVTQDAWLAAWCRRSPKISLNKGEIPWRGVWSAKRMAASALGRQAPVEPPQVTHLPDQQAFAFRHGGIEKPTLVVSFAGGHNAENHNHNDVGHVSLAAEGRFIFCDMGNARYTADFFGPKRYTYTVTSSLGHNVPSVNGYAQRAGRHPAVVLQADTAARRVSMDLTAAYPPESGLASLVRTLENPDDATVLLSDEFDVTGQFEEAFWCLEEPTVFAHGVSAGTFEVRFDPPPTKLEAVPHDAGAMCLREYEPGTTLWRVSATFDAAGPGRVTVQFRRQV
ncbi:MAG: hypothetical protein ACFCVE_07505, partial [Phycisphaerae bacterium]